MQLRHVTTEPSLVIIVERGDDLPKTIRDVCLDNDITSALIDGNGRVSWVVLDVGSGARRRVEGPLELLSLQGRTIQKGTKLEVELRGVLSRDLDTGPQIVGGLIIEAKAEGALARITRHVPSARAAAQAAPASWSAVAAASQEQILEEDDDDDRLPSAGDTVEHPKFGPVAVRGIDQEHIRVRAEGGRTISLRLSHLSFKFKGELSNGKRIFTLDVRKGR